MVHSLVRVLWFVVGWIELAAFTLFLYALSFLPKAWLSGFYPRLFWIWCRFFVRALGVDLRLHQKNVKPLPEQYILVANHPSAFEDIGIPALFDVYSLAKIEVKDWWFVGRITAAAGTLYVKRESEESRSAALEQMLAELRQGRSLAIYPEGGCKGRRLYSSFRFGAFDASLRSGVPILPVFLHYEAQEDFEWQSPDTLIHKLWHFMTSRNNRVNYYLYDAISPDQFSDKKAYCEYVYRLFLAWQARYLE